MRCKIFGYILLLLIPFFIISNTGIAEEKQLPVEYEAGFYYTVKKGDTLWDLSQQFSDSAWQWPDLWGENTQLTNPHWIYPGQRIRLFQKNWVDQVIIPEAPPESEPPPVERVYFLYPSMDMVGFLRKEPVQPNGAIFNVQGDKEMISEGDIVYVRQMGSIPFEKGSLFTAYKTLKPPIGAEGKRYKGVQHYLTGQIEIIQKKSDYAIAKVVQSYRTISKNDFVMPYFKKSPEIDLINSINGLDGQILFSEEHANIIGDNTIVFINKGDEDGVRPGQFYRIYYQENKQINPSDSKRDLLDPVDFGQLLVLHTEQDTSTVLITQADKTISPGSRFRGINPVQE